MTENRKPFSRPLFALLLGVLFALALFIRLNDFSDLPLDFHPTRQLFSALKARGMCYQTRADVPAWQRETALRQWHAQAAIEPPIVEHLAAWACAQWTLEVWQAGRAFSIFFWLVGGVGVWLAARRLAGAAGTLVAVAFYLFLPYGVFASRSFQPDPLMVALLALFFAAALAWREQPDLRRTLLTASLGGAAIFVKSVAVFIVGMTLAALTLERFGWRSFWRRKSVWLLAALTIAPAALYTLYGLLVTGDLGSQFGGRFFPSMLVSPFFYLRWELKLALVLGQLGIALTLLAAFLVPRRGAAFLAGAWGGYLLFGLVFNYHFSTHDYYHLPAVPLAALTLAALGDAIWEALARRQGRRAALIFAGALLFAVLGTVWNVRGTLRETDYRPQAQLYATIGDLLGHEARAVALTPDYGYRLAYWGWLDAAFWPTVGDLGYSAKRGATPDVDAIFASRTRGRDFFIITDLDELARQPFLQAALAAYPLFAQGEGYLIYDLRTP